MGIGVILKKGAFVISKYAPEILTYGGLVTMVGGTVLACRQTPKAIQIVEETKKNLSVIKGTHEEAEANNGQVQHFDGDGNMTMITYSKQDYQKDLAIAHTNNVKNLAKTYAVPAVMLVGGIACVLGGHGILRKRNAVAIATLGSVMEGFKKYRGNVIKDLGEVADRKYLYGAAQPERVETVNAETGEVTQEIRDHKKLLLDIPETDPRFLVYNKATCPEMYKGNLLADLASLKSAQSECNDYLHMYGNLTVNRAREILGAKAIPEGCDNGWVLDGNGDGFVDFNLFDSVTGDPKDWVMDLVYENQGIPIEFNIDGNIKALLARPRNAR